jgi:3-dehydroquinate synthase
LPVTIPVTLDSQAVIETLQTDKKVKAGKVRFILPTQIGQVTMTDQVPSEIIQEVLEEIKSSLH